jgi:poly-gamma-glutamate biosynthesis protein PgsC/CapC
MHLYLFSGIAVSLVLAELTGFSPGGVVVAGYLAMFLDQPRWLLGTYLAALITYGLLALVKDHVLLYGRRLFAVYVLTGILVSQLAGWVLLRRAVPELGLLVIGYLIPGLMAKDFARQGILPTTLWLAAAIVLTRLIVLAGTGLLW